MASQSNYKLRMLSCLTLLQSMSPSTGQCPRFHNNSTHTILYTFVALVLGALFVLAVNVDRHAQQSEAKPVAVANC